MYSRLLVSDGEHTRLVGMHHAKRNRVAVTYEIRHYTVLALFLLVHNDYDYTYDYY
jgi:hypothetical protein